MNLQFYLEKLQSTTPFKNFLKENPKAFLCSGFFVISKENKKGEKDEKTHLDFFSPEKEKVFSFDMNDNGKIIPLENFEKNPERISENCKLDFEEMEKLILEEMEKQKIKTKIQKLIFSLQAKDKKDFAIGTAFIPMLGIIKFEIDLQKNKVQNMEKKSLFDLVKITSKKKD